MKEAKDAAKNSRRTSMTGLNASINTNVAKRARRKEKRRQATEQQGTGGSGRSKAESSSQPPPPVLAPTLLQVINSTTSELSQGRADQSAAEEEALLRDNGEGLGITISKDGEALLRNSEPEEMEVDSKGHDQEAQHSNSESSSGIGYSSVPIKKKEARLSNRESDKKTEKKEARNSGRSDGAASASGSGGKNSPKSFWI